MQSGIERKLEIGFADFLTLEKRKTIIESPISICEFRNYYKCNFAREVGETMDWLEKGGNRRIWFSGSPGYPDFQPLSRNLPYFICVEGSLPLPSLKASVVGTRRVDWEGSHESFRTGLKLAANGIGVVTGNAEGCDQGAVMGAITANENGCSAPLISVLGCGLEINYPYGSERIRKRIIDAGGSILSRFSPKMPPLKHNFPNRNQIIAAMGNVCIVIQCPVRSGSQITADLAMQMGRDIYISRAGLGTGRSRTGTQRLFEEGCPVFDDSVSLEFDVQRAESGFRYADAYYRICPQL